MYQLCYRHAGCSLLWFTWHFFFSRQETQKRKRMIDSFCFPIYLLLDKILSYKLGPAMQLKRLWKNINFKLNQPRNVCWIYEFFQILLVYEISFISYFAGQNTVTYKNKLEKYKIAPRKYIVDGHSDCDSLIHWLRVHSLNDSCIVFFLKEKITHVHHLQSARHRWGPLTYITLMLYLLCI